MNAGYTFHDTVREPFAGTSVLDFYATRYPKSGTRDAWAERLARGQISLNGQLARADTVLRAGDRLVYRRAPWEEPPAPTDLPVVFEDDDLLAVNKPAGLPVLPGGGFLERTVVRLLRSGSPHLRTVAPVHCLDRGTSGLLLLGKNRETLSALGRALQARKVSRLYLAVLDGLVAENEFSVSMAIGLVPHEAASAAGKPSRTDFHVLDRDPVARTSLVLATPHTGRTHQIRIHAAVAGHPLSGEPFYVPSGLWDPDAAAQPGAHIPLPGGCGFRLHAWQMTFTHPRSGSAVRLVCPPPEHFWERPLPTFP